MVKKSLEGGIPETTELLKQRFDYIFFTGSAHVGKIVGRAANEHLTPCTLELGGKCPVYIHDKGVHMETAVKRLLWGKMINLGQTCVAPDYILCSESVKAEFLKTLKKISKEFYGDDLQATPDLGRILNDRNYNRLTSLLDKTTGKIVYGGERDAAQKYLSLTVVTDFPGNDVTKEPLMSEELFGPIWPIITVSNVHEAIKFINERDKALSLYIFTEDMATQKLMLDNTTAGSVCVNDAIVQLTVSTLPFGGVGASGYGAYHGPFTFETFSHAKSVLARDFGYIGEKLGEKRYPPLSDARAYAMAALIKARKLPTFAWLKYVACVGLGVAAVFAYRVAAKKLGYDDGL
jgi:acyl-CoA reductase-like NAD-dependent aldehyde dehydrogenase